MKSIHQALADCKTIVFAQSDRLRGLFWTTVALSISMAASTANGQTFYSVTSLADSFGNDGVVTLREAIQAANTDSAFFDAPAGDGADFIEFHADLFTSGAQTLNLAGSELLITDDLTITGPGRELLSINANQLSRVFNVDDGLSSVINVTVSDLTIKEGSVDEPGGGIWNGEHLTVTNATITDNHSTTNIIGNDNFRNGGGGIYNFSGTLEIFDSTVSDNSASVTGGGIMGSSGSLTTITRCLITNNDGHRDGGGVGISHGGTMTINDSTISENQSDLSDGGGVYARKSGTSGALFLNIHDSVISNNMRGSNQNGGGVYNDRGTLTMSNSTISDNVGGGIYQLGPGSITESVIDGNDSSNDGGVASGRVGGGVRIYVESGIFEIIDSTITNNNAGDGGGVFINSGNVAITGSTISGNSCITSSDGGGIGGGGSLTLTNSTVSGNMAGPTGQGGGLYIESGAWTVRNSTIANNSADIGGGVRVITGTLNMDSTLVGDNNALSLADDVSGTVSGQFNLVEDPTGAFLLDPNNIFGVDPGLKPLSDNGGSTLTHDLFASSAAVNNGSNPAGLLIDQRGQPRVNGAQTDIGAVEAALIFPDSRKLADGVLTNGQLPDLFVSDDLRFEIDPSPTKNLLKQRIDLIVQSTSPTITPTRLSFSVESSMLGGPSGDVFQTVELFNYVTGLRELVDSRAVTNSDESIEIMPTGDLSRFVNQINGEITAIVIWRVDSFTGNPFTWSIDVDQTVWLLAD